MPPRNPRKGTVQRGNKAQRDCANYLESLGYKVHVAVRSRHHANDIFGAFDIIATRENEPCRFIQVTDVSNQASTGNIYHRRRKVERIPLEPTFNSIEVWAYVKSDDDVGVSIHDYISIGTTPDGETDRAWKLRKKVSIET